MTTLRPIKNALISVYDKRGLDELLRQLNSYGVRFISTGGTRRHIEQQGFTCAAVEDLTGYPSILGGRVKTLHPKVFGGILNRRDNADDRRECSEFELQDIDLVIVDLYPFEDTVASGADEVDIIEKIDIGGISLIRAAAKNFADVAIVASKAQYGTLLAMMNNHSAAATSLEERRLLAREAFAVTSAYDSHIFNYFDAGATTALRTTTLDSKVLRYGENPHQQGVFCGRFDDLFAQLHGKEISYNNLLDIDAAVNLVADFNEPTFAILKHNNACGLACRETLLDAFNAALAGDPVSAFGGIQISNRTIDKATAEEMNNVFIEVCIAPGYEPEALEILKQKKNRIILVMRPFEHPKKQYRSVLNGALVQDIDNIVETRKDLQTVTELQPTKRQVDDLLFANIVVKHSKSNAIVLAKDKMLIASGVGQTSRVDALKQAIAKAGAMGHSLKGAVMASDAFFPFADCVQLAREAGITAVIQPGGSIRDQESIDYCNAHEVAMVTTGVRHFKH